MMTEAKNNSQHKEEEPLTLFPSQPYEKLSPMLKQYLDIKKLHSNKFVFFRLGDFFELFYDDAKKAAKILGIVLTQRNHVPMCGVPHHQLRNYASKLLAQGEKVVIVDQLNQLTQRAGKLKNTSPSLKSALLENNDTPPLEKPENKETKPFSVKPSIIQRRITHILSPGTAWEEISTAERENNYILGIFSKASSFELNPAKPKKSHKTADTNNMPEQAAEEKQEQLQEQLQDEVQSKTLRHWVALLFDVSTGDSEFFDFGEDTLSSFSQRLSLFDVRELVLPPRYPEREVARLFQTFNGKKLVNTMPASLFSHAKAGPALRRFYANASLEAGGGILSAEASGLYEHALFSPLMAALLVYVEGNLGGSLPHLKQPSIHRLHDRLIIDVISFANLEIFENSEDRTSRYTLLETLDTAKTAMGGRLLRRMLLGPLSNQKAIQQRLAVVDVFFNQKELRQHTSHWLTTIADLERLAAKLSMHTLEPRQLLKLAQSLKACSHLLSLLASHASSFAATFQTSKDKGHPAQSQENSPAALLPNEGFKQFLQCTRHYKTSQNAKVFTECTNMPKEKQENESHTEKGLNLNLNVDLNLSLNVSLHYAATFLAGIASSIEETLSENPGHRFGEQPVIIRSGLDENLDSLRAVQSNFNKELQKLLEKERQQTGMHLLKIKRSEKSGAFFVVSKQSLAHVPAHFKHRQSLVGSQRFVSAQLTLLEQNLKNSEEQLAVVERKLFISLLAKIASVLSFIKDMATFTAYIDVFSSFAELALLRNFIKPKIAEASEALVLKGARHPVVEQHVAEAFIPNNLVLASGRKEHSFIHILTGPNMAGKSTFLRQTALICLMAHLGSFVPAQAATIPVLKRIFTRISSSDRLFKGQSTFLVEMNEAATIVREANDQSLVIMDEVGRGTSTYDGLALAWSILEYLCDEPSKRPRILFATHYHEMTSFKEGREKSVSNYTMAVKELPHSLLFLRKVIAGESKRSYGIEVARLAGFPKKVLSRAQHILKGLENKKLG